MSKRTAPPTESPAQTIPLSDVTITCYRQPHVSSEEDEKPITVPGRQIAQILAWLLRTRPGAVGGRSDSELWEASEIAAGLEGLDQILIGLSESNLEDIPADLPPLFSLLSDITRDLAGRLSASEDGDEMLKRATITVPTRKETAV